MMSQTSHSPPSSPPSKQIIAGATFPRLSPLQQLHRRQSLPVNGTPQKVTPADTRYTHNAANTATDGNFDNNGSGSGGFEFEFSTTLIPLAESEREDEKIDLGHLSTDRDFVSIKKSDAFLFYSIPEVRRRSLLFSGDFEEFEDEDEEDEEDDDSFFGLQDNDYDNDHDYHDDKPQQKKQQTGQTWQNTTPPLATKNTTTNPNITRRVSCPAGMLANAEIRLSLEKAGTTVVTRNRRLSVEAHPSVMIEEEFLSMMGGDDDCGCWRGDETASSSSLSSSLYDFEELFNKTVLNEDGSSSDSDEDNDTFIAEIVETQESLTRE